MTRRTLLEATGAVGWTTGFSANALSVQMNSPLIRPKALKPGDTVGLITPSTYVSDPVRLDLAEKTVQHFGLKLKVGKNVRKREGYLGGSVQERTDDLHAMFSDPEVKGIFCIRGGYGASQLLNQIDYGLIRKNPKVFAGYSDITALHLAIQRHAGVVTFHSPVVLSQFTAWTQDHFRQALFETTGGRKVQNPEEVNPLRPVHPTRTIRPGKAKGTLIGGNLTLISSLMGTPYEPDTRGKILFIEEVGEEPYRIDRMLTQLKLAGKIDQAAGLIIGECSGCVPREFKPGFESTFSFNEVLENLLSSLSVPVFSGLLIGHTDDQATIPLGVAAEMDADACSLTILQSGVM